MGSRALVENPAEKPEETGYQPVEWQSARIAGWKGKSQGKQAWFVKGMDMTQVVVRELEKTRSKGETGSTGIRNGIAGQKMLELENLVGR